MNICEELNPVKCGCGGEPSYYDDRWHGCCGIQCIKCGIDMSNCESREEAIRKWNTAMGAGRNKTTKGVWMVSYDGFHCSACNYKCETTALPNVCPRCGINMWTNKL